MKAADHRLTSGIVKSVGTTLQVEMKMAKSVVSDRGREMVSSPVTAAP